MEELYYPLSKWTEGDQKPSQLSCLDGNPTPAGLWDASTGKPWITESTATLSSVMLASRAAANPRKDASVTAELGEREEE